MKKIYVIVITCFLFAACKKENTATTPVADFSFDKQKSNVVLVPENNTFIFQNDSKSAASYLWDFGNGNTSIQKNPNVNFPDHGLYNVSLTVTSVNGQTDKTEKQIKVVVPVIKTITVTELDLTGQQSMGIPAMDRADTWVEVKVKDKAVPDKLLSNGTIERNLFYKTAVVSSAVNSNANIAFNVAEEKLLSHNLGDKSYAIELYARAENGNTYLLYSTDFIGSSFLGNIQANQFKWGGSFYSGVEITGNYK